MLYKSFHLNLIFRVGIVFEGDFRDHSVSINPIRFINYLGEMKKYELIRTLEFDSDRKRMSVIVRCFETSRILVLSKGAEDSIFNICESGNVTECGTILKEFAVNGWRTLALGYKILSEKQLDEINNEIETAMNDINNRDSSLKLAYERIESDLTLIGSTAVEDRLQEDVARTLEALRLAGIKVWVLTGDKQETAVNISQSCKHFSPEMERLYLTGFSKEEEIKDQLKNHRKK